MPVLYMERSALDGLTETEIKKIIDENEKGTKYEYLGRYYEGKHSLYCITTRPKEVSSRSLC